tara:strand:- start:42 stop:971 length:930 start_codon:yes stop_codon:yes gene_type:complete
MLKKVYFVLLILFFSNSFAVSNTDVYIFATVNNKIITNFDIKKEINYLKILNPSLSKLKKEKILELAKNSLINEYIKKGELEKIFDLDMENLFAEEYLKNLYKKLNFANEKDFKKALTKSKNYSLDEVKKKLRIEILWNELIYKKYGNQVKIDKDILMKKVENFKNKTLNEYLLSEIVFKKNKDENIDNLINNIKLSIQEIGFDNTANIYSISDSSKMGGNIGWIKENNLSDLVYENIKKINKGEYTSFIKLGNNYLILKINEVRTEKILINKDEELKKMIKFETNKQLNQYSKIYFDKTKINYNINEK